MPPRRKSEPRPVPRHCDDYIDDATQPAALRTFLEWARQHAHGLLVPEPHPTLFATYQGGQGGHPASRSVLVGQRVRVTMASRLGTVGITSDHTATTGYEDRVYLDQLHDFAAGA